MSQNPLAEKLRKLAAQLEQTEASQATEFKALELPDSDDGVTQEAQEIHATLGLTVHGHDSTEDDIEALNWDEPAAV